MNSVTLACLVEDFAAGIRRVDSTAPVWIATASGRAYAPGVGPHPEAATVQLVMSDLSSTIPHFYDAYRLGVPCPSAPRQRCDIVVGHGAEALAVEIKLLRFMGDNGKPNDNMLMHILSPYPAHRSAVTDCKK